MTFIKIWIALHDQINKCGKVQFFWKLLGIKISGMIQISTITKYMLKLICTFMQDMEVQDWINILHLNNGENNILDCCLRVSIQCTCHTCSSMFDLSSSCKKRVGGKTFNLLRQSHVHRNERS